MKKKISVEELESQNLLRELRELREEHYIPEPPPYVYLLMVN